MRKFLTVIAAIAVSWPALAKNIEATVDGATLNLTEKQLTGILGKPAKVVQLERNECADSAEKALHYDGMVVTLTESAKGGFDVTVIDVSSPTRNVGGVRIGDTVERVREIFGAAELADDTLSYNLGPEGSSQAYEFTIKDGRVSAIKLNSFMC